MCRKNFPSPLMLLAVLAFAVAGCNRGCGHDSVTDEGHITLQARQILSSTAAGYFTLGYNNLFGGDEQPYGGLAEIDTSTDPWEASIRFYDVPEGEYAGMGYHGFQQISLDSSLPLGYCYLEEDTSLEILNVVSGGRNMVVDLAPQPESCLGEVAFDKFVVNPNYEFDFVHRVAGSIDGENIITGYIQTATASSPVSVRANPDDSTNPVFGVFSALPDTTMDAWLAPADWLDRLDTLTDANGQLVFYLVVKPGTPPMTWRIDVETSIGTERLRARVSNGNAVSLTTE